MNEKLNKYGILIMELKRHAGSVFCLDGNFAVVSWNDLARFAKADDEEARRIIHSLNWQSIALTEEVLAVIQQQKQNSTSIEWQ